MTPTIHSFDSEGLYLGSAEMPPFAVSVNSDVATIEPLPQFNPDTHRARWVNKKWKLELIPQPEPEVEPEPLPAETLLLNAKSALQRKNSGVYMQFMGAIAQDYPQYERESWPIQISEAKALQADPQAATPWIDACALQRGLDRAELVQCILDKDAAFRFASGTLTGIRQMHEDAINALSTIDQAQTYDLGAGWPVQNESQE